MAKGASGKAHTNERSFLLNVKGTKENVETALIEKCQNNREKVRKLTASHVFRLRKSLILVLVKKLVTAKLNKR